MEKVIDKTRPVFQIGLSPLLFLCHLLGVEISGVLPSRLPCASPIRKGPLQNKTSKVYWGNRGAEQSSAMLSRGVTQHSFHYGREAAFQWSQQAENTRALSGPGLKVALLIALPGWEKEKKKKKERERAFE